MSDERRPAAYSLADELRDNGLFDDAKPVPGVEVPLTPEGVLAATSALFDRTSRHRALAEYAGVKPDEPAKPAANPKRSEIVASIADKLEKRYAGRLDRLAAIPRSASFDELSGMAKERLLDAIAEVESRQAMAAFEPPTEDEYTALHAELDDEIHSAWGDDDYDEAA